MATKKKKSLFERRKFEATFIEGLLATKPNSREVHHDYVALKRGEASEDELSAQERAMAKVDALDKGRTIFHCDTDGTPIIWDYQLKGFLKEACKALKRNPESACAALKAYKSIIDLNIFIYPRMIRLELPKGGKIGTCERPLRAQTAMGERVALASSDEAPAGTKIHFEIEATIPKLWDAIEEILDYATRFGLGAWRGSGAGRMEVKEVEED